MGGELLGKEEGTEGEETRPVRFRAIQGYAIKETGQSWLRVSLSPCNAGDSCLRDVYSARRPKLICTSSGSVRDSESSRQGSRFSKVFVMRQVWRIEILLATSGPGLSGLLSPYLRVIENFTIFQYFLEKPFARFDQLLLIGLMEDFLRHCDLNGTPASRSCKTMLMVLSHILAYPKCFMSV